jgi:hypothetical protein
MAVTFIRCIIKIARPENQKVCDVSLLQDLSIIWFVDDRVSPIEVTRTAA